MIPLIVSIRWILLVAALIGLLTGFLARRAED